MGLRKLEEHRAKLQRGGGRYLGDGEHHVGPHHHVDTQRPRPDLLQIFLVILALNQLPRSLHRVGRCWG